MLRPILPLALLLVALVPPAVAGPLPELRVSAIPDENPQELLRIYQAFAEYLARELKMPVRFVPVLDYAATVEALAAEKLDPLLDAEQAKAAIYLPLAEAVVLDYQPHGGLPGVIKGQIGT